MNRFEEAGEVLEEALALDPKNASVLQAIASVSWNTGNFEGAVNAIRLMLELQPNSPSAWDSLGLNLMRQGRMDEAEAAFKKGLEIDPNFLALHHNYGILLQTQNRLKEAEFVYHRLTELNPTIGASWVNLGNVLIAMKDRGAAECFRAGSEAAAPGPAKDQLSAQWLFYGQGDLHEAATLLRKVVEARPEDASAFGLLGTVEHELGHFEEAGAALERALELAPENYAVYLDLVNTKKISAADMGLVKRLQGLLAKPGLKSEGRTHLLYALAKTSNDLGEYQNALALYGEANSLAKNLLGTVFDHDRVEESVDLTIRRYSSDWLARTSASGRRSDLPVLILGMPRSGTTLTERMLSAHPQVRGAGELGFWHREQLDADGFEDSEGERLGAGYLAALEAQAEGRPRVTDKTPDNFGYIGPILTSVPGAKIIHVRRHPVDNCLSLYMTPLAFPRPYAYDLADLVFAYRAYEKLMAHWRRLLPPEQFMEVRYEDLIDNTEEVARSMVRFVGLEWNDACLSPEKNEQEIRTASVWQARQPISRNSLMRWKRYEPWLGPLRDLLTPEERSTT
jgi:tetratricopeptide (TPR) repeat protein